jgi:uncharacterized protein
MLRSTFRRLLSLDDPPERTALAFSVGVFIAFCPFLGLHSIMAIACCLYFRLNKIAVFAGAFINNPFLTLVPIIIASFGIGAYLMGRPVALPAQGLELLKHPHIFDGSYWHELLKSGWEILLPFTLGGMILSILTGLISYPLSLHILRLYHRPKEAEPLQ